MTPLDYAARICYSSRETLNFTYEVAKKLKDLPGVYVETGVAAGAQIIAMAYAAPNKTIYAFDSFQGLPLPSNRDDQMPGIRMLNKHEASLLPNPGEQVLESTGATSVSFNSFWQHLQDSGIDRSKVIAVIGWFEEMMPVDYVKDISLLRLDGDLYNSTWVCLQNLFPKVIQGGCVIIDDWSLKGCQDACKEYFELIGYEPEWKFISTIAYFYK